RSQRRRPRLRHNRRTRSLSESCRPGRTPHVRRRGRLFAELAPLQSIGAERGGTGIAYRGPCPAEACPAGATPGGGDIENETAFTDAPSVLLPGVRSRGPGGA